MRITKDTPDRLVLEARPWVLGVILILAILLMAFLAFAVGQEVLWAGLGLGAGAAVFALGFVAFVRRVIVILDREAGAVVVRSASLMGQTEQTLPLADIARAAVETIVSQSSSGSRHTSGTSQSHRPVLRMTDGTTVPLTLIHTSGQGAQVAVDALNRWLGRPVA